MCTLVAVQAAALAVALSCVRAEHDAEAWRCDAPEMACFGVSEYDPVSGESFIRGGDAQCRAAIRATAWWSAARSAESYQHCKGYGVEGVPTDYACVGNAIEDSNGPCCDNDLCAEVWNCILDYAECNPDNDENINWKACPYVSKCGANVWTIIIGALVPILICACVIAVVVLRHRKAKQIVAPSATTAAAAEGQDFEHLVEPEQKAAASTTLAVIHGLVGAAQHNGKTCTLVQFDQAKGRFIVALSGSGAAQLAVKPANLELQSLGLGTPVAVHGLQDAPQHNGKFGVVVGGPDPKSGRYAVQINGETKGTALLLKLVNLKLAELICE